VCFVSQPKPGAMARGKALVANHTAHRQAGCMVHRIARPTLRAEKKQGSSRDGWQRKPMRKDDRRDPPRSETKVCTGKEERRTTGTSQAGSNRSKKGPTAEAAPKPIRVQELRWQQRPAAADSRPSGLDLLVLGLLSAGLLRRPRLLLLFLGGQQRSEGRGAGVRKKVRPGGPGVAQSCCATQATGKQDAGCTGAGGAASCERGTVPTFFSFFSCKHGQEGKTQGSGRRQPSGVSAAASSGTVAEEAEPRSPVSRGQASKEGVSLNDTHASNVRGNCQGCESAE
jgi:hypothetical protein